MVRRRMYRQQSRGRCRTFVMGAVALRSPDPVVDAGLQARRCGHQGFRSRCPPNATVLSVSRCGTASASLLTCLPTTLDPESGEESRRPIQTAAHCLLSGDYAYRRFGDRGNSRRYANNAATLRHQLCLSRLRASARRQHLARQCHARDVPYRHTSRLPTKVPVPVNNGSHRDMPGSGLWFCLRYNWLQRLAAGLRHRKPASASTKTLLCATTPLRLHFRARMLSSRLPK